MKELKNYVVCGLLIGLSLISGISIYLLNDASDMCVRFYENYNDISVKYQSLQDEVDRKDEVIQALKNDIKELQFKPKWTSLGTFKITAYGVDCIGCTGITKSGTLPQEGRTIAVDPTVIPLGSEVYFDGEIYIAEDIGGAIKGNIIDLFYGTEQKSIDYGVQYHTVYVKEQGKWNYAK